MNPGIYSLPDPWRLVGKKVPCWRKRAPDAVKYLEGCSWYHAQDWRFELLPRPASVYGRDELLLHEPGGKMCGYTSWDRRAYGCSECGRVVPAELEVQFALLRKEGFS